MADRDEVQSARWKAIREPVGAFLRDMRRDVGSVSQARLSGDLEALGYRFTQSMVSRYEQGAVDAPLSLERIVGWALCCEALSAPTFHELMAILGFRLASTAEDLARFDRLLSRYRALPLPDQVVLRRSLLWHILGLTPTPSLVDASFQATVPDPVRSGSVW